MNSLLMEQMAAEQAMRKRKAELAEDDARLAIKRAKMREWQEVREEKVRQADIQRAAKERIATLEQKDKAFELEFSNDNSVGHTDIAPFPPMPAVPKLDDYLKVARVSYANLPRHSTDDEVTKGFPPSQSRKTPFNDPSHSIPLYDQDPSILKTLPGNMEVFKGNNDPNMSNVWAVSCARQECRTNTRKRGELLKGAKGVCLHARCSHYQAWKPIFEGKSEQTKLFSSNPDWCHWYQLTKAEHEEWYDTGKVPEIAMPRGVATPFMPSKPPTHRFSDD